MKHTPQEQTSCQSLIVFEHLLIMIWWRGGVWLPRSLISNDQSNPKHHFRNRTGFSKLIRYYLIFIESFYAIHCTKHTTCHLLFYCYSNTVVPIFPPLPSSTHLPLPQSKKYGTLHKSVCHPCAGAMLFFSVSCQCLYLCCQHEHLNATFSIGTVAVWAGYYYSHTPDEGTEG